MANLFEQFHVDFPATFADLPVKEKKKKKKNIFSRAAEELGDVLVEPARASEDVTLKDESSQAQIEAALDHIADLQATGVTGPQIYSAEDEGQRTQLGQQMSGWAAEAEGEDTLIDYLLGVIKPIDRMKSTGSFLIDILRQLGRPGSAVLTAAKKGAEAWKDPEGWKSDRILTGPGGFPIPQRAIEEGVKGLWKGFTYEDETRGQDFLSKEFRQDNPKTAFGLGFAIDWLTDPLTYGAHRLLTGPIEAGIKGAGKLLSKSEGLMNMAHRMSASTLANSLNIHMGEAKIIKRLADNFRDRLKGAHSQAEQFMRSRMLELKKIADDAGISVDDLNKSIIDDIERGTIGTSDSITARISDDAARVAKEDVRAYDEILRLEQEAGVDIGDLINRAEELGIEGYIPHVATLVARRKIQGGWRGWTRPVTVTHALKRKHAGTIGEINERMIGEVDQFLHYDPALLRSLRQSRSAQEIAYVNFNDSVKQFGRHADEFPEGAYPKDFVAVDGIPDVKFPKHLARTIESQRNILRGKDSLDEFLKYADQFQNLWKMWTLGVRPAYHMRNFVGNLWNAYTVAGVKDPRVFNTARQMQIAFLHKVNPDWARKMGAKVDPQTGRVDVGKFSLEGNVGDTGVTYQKLIDEAMQRGVFGKGQYGVGSDVLYNLERGLERTAQGGLSSMTGAERAKALLTPTTENIVLRGGFKVGNVIEDNARLAVFLDTFKKTGSFDDAAQMVKRSLFDYSDLSPFERSVMKRVLPFYTWTRKNIPAQIIALWKNPERGRKLDIARTQVEFELGRPDPEDVYEFYNRGVPLYISKEEKGEVWKMYRMLNYLPIADIERTTDFKQMFSEMLTPLFKTPYEMMNNYDTFRNKQIEQFKNETTDFLGVRMPVRMAHLAQLLVPVAELNRANPLGMFGEAYKDEETGEWSRTKSWGMDQPLVGFTVPNLPIPGIGKLIKGKYEFGGTPRESTRDQPPGIRFMQYSLGLRPYYVSAGEGKKYKVKNFNRDLRSLKYYLFKAENRGQSRRATELLELIRLHELADKRAKLDEKFGDKAKYPHYSRYYER